MNTQTTISLSSSALLVDLSVRGWLGIKQDKKATAENNERHHAQSNRASKVQKSLFADCEELVSVNKYGACVRNWHASQTLPWSDNGIRLLIAAKLPEYQSTLRLHIDNYKNLARQFLGKYDELMMLSQFTLGGMWNPDDYPSVDEISDRFEVIFSFQPVPEQGDFRVDIGLEGMEDLQEQFERDKERRINEVRQSIKAKMRTLVERLSHTLRDENGQKGRVHSATVDAALAMCDELDDGNILTDPDITAMRRELSGILELVDVTDLRTDDYLRATTKQNLDNLLDKFKW